MRAIQLPEIRSPASTQLASSARGPPGAKGAGQRCHGAFDEAGEFTFSWRIQMTYAYILLSLLGLKKLLRSEMVTVTFLGDFFYFRVMTA